MEEDTEYYVYELTFPGGYIAHDGTDLNNVPFYIGKGHGHRIADHEYQARCGDQSMKSRIIRRIWEQGMNVRRRIVFRTRCEQEALGHEIRCITNASSSPYLTNVMRGSGRLDRFAPELWREAFGEVYGKSALILALESYGVKTRFGGYYLGPEYTRMPALIEHGDETFFNTSLACDFTGIGRRGTRFLQLASEYGLVPVLANNVSFYRKGDLVSFLEWVNKSYPSESVSPNSNPGSGLVN